MSKVSKCRLIALTAVLCAFGTWGTPYARAQNCAPYGVFPTPTPTPAPDSGGTIIQPAPQPTCLPPPPSSTPTNTPTATSLPPTAPPLPTRTPNPQFTPALGDDTGGPNAPGELQDDSATPYVPNVQTYNFAMPSYPEISSPTPWGEGRTEAEQFADFAGLSPTQLAAIDEQNQQAAEVEGMLPTIQDIAEDDTQFLMPDGSALDIQAEVTSWTPFIVEFIGYIKGLLQQAHFWGVAAIFITLPILTFVWVATLRMWEIFRTLAAALITLLARIFSRILEFLKWLISLIPGVG